MKILSPFLLGIAFDFFPSSGSQCKNGAWFLVIFVIIYQFRFSVIYALISDSANRRLEKKEMMDVNEVETSE